MKFTLSQSSYHLRDAGEVAFGILVMAVLVAAGAILVGAMLTAFWPQRLPLLGVSSGVWAFGMLGVLRHYRQATRTWTTERRGGDMLLLVECIVAVVSLTASFFLGTVDAEMAFAVRACLAGFLLLLVFSHVATYALLRYRPRLKEIAAWTGIAIAVVIELSQNP